MLCSSWLLLLNVIAVYGSQANTDGSDKVYNFYDPNKSWTLLEDTTTCKKQACWSMSEFLFVLFVPLALFFGSIGIMVICSRCCHGQQKEERSDFAISQYMLESTYYSFWLQSLIGEVQKDDYGRDASSSEELKQRKDKIISEVNDFEHGIVDYWYKKALKRGSTTENITVHEDEVSEIDRAFNLSKGSWISLLEETSEYKGISIPCDENDDEKTKHQDNSNRKEECRSGWMKVLRTVKGTKFVRVLEDHIATSSFEFSVKVDEILCLSQDEPVKLRSQSYWKIEKMGETRLIPQSKAEKMTNGYAMLCHRSLEIQSLRDKLLLLLDEKHRALASALSADNIIVAKKPSGNQWQFVSMCT